MILEKNFETKSLVDRQQLDKVISFESASTVLGYLRL